MSASLFSIITVTKNNLEGLKRTAASVEMQSCRDFEWIVIDGASDDGTPSYLKTLDALTMSEQDNGIYDAMNKGIERARGEYLIFMNAGDQFEAAFALQKIADDLADGQEKSYARPDFIYGDSIEFVAGRGAFSKPAGDWRAYDRGMFTHHQAMLYRRAALGDMRYDVSYSIAGDYDLTARLLSQIDPDAVLICRYPICIFEAGGVSQKNPAAGRHEQFQIRKKLALAGPFQNRMITARQMMAQALRAAVPSLYWLLKSGDNTMRG